MHMTLGNSAKMGSLKAPFNIELIPLFFKKALPNLDSPRKSLIIKKVLLLIALLINIHSPLSVTE